MTMVNGPTSSSHQERIETTIKQLEGALLNGGIPAIQAQPSSLQAGEAETPRAISTALKNYLEEGTDEAGVVVYTRLCDVKKN